MTNRLNWTLIFVLPLVSLTSAVCGVETKSREADPDMVSSAVRGERVKLECFLPKVARVDRPARFTAKITNASDEVITFGSGNHLNNLLLSITDADGIAVPLTRYGSMWLSEDGGSLQEEFSYVIGEFKPGVSFTVQDNLCRLFDLSMPGEYVLTVKWYSYRNRDVNGDLPDLVKTQLAFKVVEADQLAEEELRAEAKGDGKGIR